jgi:hypothetical protein
MRLPISSLPTIQPPSGTQVSNRIPQMPKVYHPIAAHLSAQTIWKNIAITATRRPSKSLRTANNSPPYATCDTSTHAVRCGDSMRRTSLRKTDNSHHPSQTGRLKAAPAHRAARMFFNETLAAYFPQTTQTTPSSLELGTTNRIRRMVSNRARDPCRQTALRGYKRAQFTTQF